MYIDLNNLECLPNVKRASYQRRQFQRSPTGGGTEGFAVKFYIRYLRFVFVVIPKRFKNSSHLLLSENKHGRTDRHTNDYWQEMQWYNIEVYTKIVYNNKNKSVLAILLQFSGALCRLSKCVTHESRYTQQTF